MDTDEKPKNNPKKKSKILSTVLLRSASLVNVSKKLSGREFNDNGKLLNSGIRLGFIFSIVVMMVLSYVRMEHERKLKPELRMSFVLPSQAQRRNVKLLRKTESTIYFVPGGELRCDWRFSYVCKFWFHVRCVLLGHLRNVVVMSNENGGLDQAAKLAQRDDVIIVVHRGLSNHAIIPKDLQRLLHLKKEGHGNLKHTKIGVFHIAPELHRGNWPWYNIPNFVIRMYWVSEHLPPHVMSVPIGPQYIDSCKPLKLTDSLPHSVTGKISQQLMNPVCSCGQHRVKDGSRRLHLWSFFGSLRRTRAYLLSLLRKDEDLKYRGVIKVASSFGGDGVFGAQNQSNPKVNFLKLIQESSFVFAPCGNVMETHRIYEAIVLGAIPVIQLCDDPKLSLFFPFRELVISGGLREMIQFVKKFIDKPQEIDRLQLRMMRWWKSYSTDVAANVSRIVFNEIPYDRRQSVP